MRACERACVAIDTSHTEDARRADVATQILVADFEVRSMRHYRAEPDA